MCVQGRFSAYVRIVVFNMQMFLLQLEVLELLVHYGADLNVRNKHDETPAGFYFVITITNKQILVSIFCVSVDALNV